MSKPSKSSNIWPKRHLSRDQSSSDSNNNPNSQWFQSSFSDNPINKRAKTCDTSSGELSALTRDLNHLTTDSSKQMEDESDPFDDDLEEILTQVTFVPGQGFTQLTPAIGTAQRTAPTATTSRPAPNVNSSADSQRTGDAIASEATEGRIKILESKNKQLNEEVTKLKAQQLVSNKKLGEMRSDYDNQLEQLKKKYESDLGFMHSESKAQQDMLEQMQTVLNKLGPNATLNSFVNISRKICPTFSQIKLQEFYGGLGPSTSGMATTSVQSSQMSTVGNVYVADSQQWQSQQVVEPMPSQVGPTQMTQSPMSVSVPPSTSTGLESMDTSSVPSSQATAKSQSSQIQFRALWEKKRTKLEEKFRQNRDQLNQLHLGQQLDLFDSHWIRSPQELHQLSSTLKSLSIQLNIRIDSF